MALWLPVLSGIMSAIANRPTGIVGCGCEVELIAPLTAFREKRRDQQAWLERRPHAFRLRQPVGDHPQRRGMEAEAEMGGAHLDIFALRPFLLQTGLPRHDAVRAGVDCGGRDVQRTRQFGDTCGGRGHLRLPGQQPPDGADIVGAGGGERAAQCHHQPHPRGGFTRDFTRQDAAETPADHTDPLAGGLEQLGHGPRDRRDFQLRQPDVAAPAPAMNVVSER